MSSLSNSRAINIFFSYATSSPQDKQLCEKIMFHLSILSKQQIICMCYDSAINLRSNFPQFLTAYFNNSDIIVLLISADFFASERCYEFEMKHALELSATGAVRLIPVLLRPTEWAASLLSQYSPLPSNGQPVTNWTKLDAALTEVARGIFQVMKECVSQTMVPHIHTLLPLYHIPYRYNPFFTGRETLLSSISTFFVSAQTMRTPILALNGLAGIGKTQIALEYCYRSAYTTILWLNASSRALLCYDINTLADRLSLPNDARENEQPLFSSLKQWLQHQTTWFLVLDHIDDLSLVDLIVPSQSQGHVLLTTRVQELGHFVSSLFVPSMTTDASVTFLLHRAGVLPPQASLDQVSAEAIRTAIAIAHAMDGFPLALDQAGAYLGETGCSLTTYLALYQQQRAKLLRERGSLVDNSIDSVTSIFGLVFQQVAQKNARHLALLRLLAFLHPDAISEGLFVSGASELSKPLQALAANPLHLYEAFAHLRNRSLIHRSSDGTLFQILRVVQAVLIDSLSRKQQRYYASMAVRLINRIFPEVRFDTWAVCECYLPQAQHCATLITNFKLTLKEAPALLERLGVYYYQHAFYVEAETYLTQALHIQEHSQEDASLEIAQILNSLALLYCQQARYQQSKMLHQRALEIREHILGSDHPKTAESLHNIALLYKELGEYQQAEQLYLKVLALEERAKGSDHLDVASTLNNLGLIYYYQGRNAPAETAYRRALTIYEHTLPSDHPDWTYPLNGLGALAERQGQVKQAEKLYQRVLAICQNAFGELHPETAHSLNKLADIYLLQGSYQQAEALYEQALHISEQVLGPEHPDVALFLNNLAFLAANQELYQQAEQLYQRALNIYEQALGTDHPDVASVLNNLGQLSRKTGNMERAEVFLKHAFAIREQVLGTTHPDTTTSLDNLADLYMTQEKFVEAEPLYEQALAIRKSLFGDEHPEMVMGLDNLASLYSDQGRYAEAELLYQRVIGLRERMLGSEHPTTVTSLSNLASLYSEQGRYAEAELLYQRVARLWEQTLGPEHPSTMTSLSNLASLYSEQGWYAEAEPLYQRVVHLRERVLGSEHPSTATSLSNLASLYSEQGRYAEAEPLYQRVLHIDQVIYGEDHITVARDLNNLGILLSQMRRYEEAEHFFHRGREIARSVSDDDDPIIGVQLENLSLVVLLLYQQDEANQVLLHVENPLFKQKDDHPHLRREKQES